LRRGLEQVKPFLLQGKTVRGARWRCKGDGKVITLNIYDVAVIVNGTPRATDDVAALKWFALDKLPNVFGIEHEYEVM